MTDSDETKPTTDLEETEIESTDDSADVDSVVPTDETLLSAEALSEEELTSKIGTTENTPFGKTGCLIEKRCLPLYPYRAVPILVANTHMSESFCQSAFSRVRFFFTLQ